MNDFRISALLGAAVLLMFFAATSSAAPGDLDPSFGSQGVALSPVGDQGAVAMTLQADGRILTATVGDAGGDRASLRITRLTMAGAIDSSFADAGVASVPVSVDTMSVVHAMLRQASDNKIVVAGRSIAAFAVTRLTAAGALDSGFGSGGTARTTIAGDDEAFALAQQGDHKLVAAGSADDGMDSDFALVRYTTGGQPDAGFSGDGIATVDFGGNDSANAVAVQDDGRIVVAGFTRGSSTDIAVARLTSAGALDSAFGSGGRVTTSVTVRDDAAWALIIQPDGKIVVAGQADDDFVLVRYTAAGQLDPAFGSGGVARTNLSAGNIDGARTLVRQGDGKLLAGGHANLARAGDFAIVRYTTAGGLDSTFGNAGVVTTSVAQSFDEEMTSLRLQDDGKLLAAGLSEDGSTTYQMVARYQTGAAGSCGNGTIENTEQCDEGTSNGTAAACCSATCTFIAATSTCRASSGVCDAAEKCTGSTATCPADSFAASSTTCRPSAGVCDKTEKCTGSSATCPANAAAAPGTACTDDGNACTDNICDGSGACIASANQVPCDDGNACTTDDTCGGGTCSGSSSLCGNGVTDSGCDETCDDANASNTDDCLNSCRSASCGDGFVRSGVEECDDGNTGSGDGCSATCQVDAVCGDADRNGSVQASDALRVLKSAVGQAVTCEAFVCDVDDNGAVQASDALRVLRKAVGQPVVLVCPGQAG